MSKKQKIALIIVAIILVIGVIFTIRLINKNKDKVNNLEDNGPTYLYTPDESAEPQNIDELSEFVDKIYESVDKDILPGLNTTVVDVTDTDMVKMATGLDSGEDLEYLVISEPMMSSQAYSLVLAKVNPGSDANTVAKNMLEKIDMRKWICVEAEKVYATNSQDMVFLVMSDEEKANAVYEAFKAQVGSIGKEYERTAAIEELPEDMY